MSFLHSTVTRLGCVPRNRAAASPGAANNKNKERPPDAFEVCQRDPPTRFVRAGSCRAPEYFFDPRGARCRCRPRGSRGGAAAVGWRLVARRELAADQRPRRAHARWPRSYLRHGRRGQANGLLHLRHLGAVGRLGRGAPHAQQHDAHGHFLQLASHPAAERPDPDLGRRQLDGHRDDEHRQQQQQHLRHVRQHARALQPT